ncbi:hypothetical protein BKA80DRAFT_284540 [Phyllosticta citrichinensis]
MSCFLHAGRLGPARDLTVSTHVPQTPRPRYRWCASVEGKRWSSAYKSDPHFAKSHGEPMRARNRSRLFLRPSALTAKAQARRVVRLSNLHHAAT